MGQTKNLALEHFGVPLDKQHCQVRGILNLSDNEQLRFCAFFSLTMVLISTVTFIVSTIDELQTDEHGMVEFPLFETKPLGRGCSGYLRRRNSKSL